jgi:hypothetical protein
MGAVFKNKHKLTVQKQIEILYGSISENIPLADYLRVHNLSYEDLVYIERAGGGFPPISGSISLPWLAGFCM